MRKMKSSRYLVYLQDGTILSSTITLTNCPFKTPYACLSSLKLL